jgi:hypothetical protein
MFVTRAVCHRTATAKAGDVAVDQVPVLVVQMFKVKLSASQGTAAPVTYQYICARGQLMKPFEVRVLIKIQR